MKSPNEYVDIVADNGIALFGKKYIMPSAAVAITLLEVIHFITVNVPANLIHMHEPRKTKSNKKNIVFWK